MAWPKLRSNKSPGHGVTSGNHSGAAPGGAQPHGPAPDRAAGGPAAEPPPDSGPGPVVPGPVVPGPVAPDEAGDTGSAPSFLDWGSQDAVEPDDLGEVSSGGGEDGTGPGPADPPKAPWKLVATRVEPAGGEPPRPGIGERRGNVAHLAANPRMRVWWRRAIIAIVVGVAFSVLVSWRGPGGAAPPAPPPPPPRPPPPQT